MPTATAINHPSLPKDVYIPEYLEDYLSFYLSGVTVPDGVDMTFLMDLGIGALNAKIRHVEEYNMTMKAGKKRIPGRLDFDEVAIILMTLFTFKTYR